MTHTPRPRGLSVRVKLTLSYAAFLVVAGIALFAVGLLVLRFVPEDALYVWDGNWAPNRGDLMEVFIRYAWWATGGLLAFGLVGGWVLAGFVLRPLDRITDAARRVRDGTLDTRVTLRGRRDELTDLADTLDAMLDRVQHTIDEERRFAANASHELRTPHTIIRTMVEVAQADPEGRDLDELLQRIARTNDRAIATTEALLALARAGRGAPIDVEDVDLAEVTTAALEELQQDAAARGIQGTVLLPPLTVTGSHALLTQLVTNLLQNAIVHNSDGGWVRVTLRAEGALASLVVENGGRILDPGTVTTLTEPFVRGEGRARRTDGRTGAGLGLAIVASIVRAHRGRLHLQPLPEGGLQVRVDLPR